MTAQETADADSRLDRTPRPHPIWSHLNGRESVDCYANAGKTDFGGWWVDKISTGNNDLIHYEVNGDSVKIERWHEVTFPNRPPQVTAIQIL